MAISCFGLHFQMKNVGEMDVISGTLIRVECIIWRMKEQKYVMTINGTGGSLVTDGCKEACSKKTN